MMYIGRPRLTTLSCAYHLPSCIRVHPALSVCLRISCPRRNPSLRFQESRLLSCHPNDPVQHVLTHNQEKAKKSVDFVMEPPLCGTWVIRSTVYVGAPPSGKYWIFSQGYMGPKCAACGAGEWSLDGKAPCRKCDDCSTRGGVKSQGPAGTSPNCTATTDTGCVLPRSCQLGLTFSTSGREPCTYVWGTHVGNRVECVTIGARVYCVFAYSCCTSSGGLCARKRGRDAKEGDMYIVQPCTTQRSCKLI